MERYARRIYGKHPHVDMLRSYIDRDAMYAMMDDGKVAVPVAVTMQQDDDCREINWREQVANDEVSVLHIPAACPGYQGKSIAKQMIRECIRLSAEQGKRCVRPDAPASNIPAHRLYEGPGFEYRDKKNLFAENTGRTDFLFCELPVVS